MTPAGNGTYGRDQTGLKLAWIQATWAANQKNIKHNIRIQSGRQKRREQERINNGSARTA